ncbi:MAG: phenylalanine--tRNA ligase subunit beta, partial [Deltaproteobacteria bacterium]|nr:phenylalanine--tRNA ligase subunit beta [Deltaproteobacteria bacterium]
FERGVDIEGVVPALRRAMSLISELAGGRIAKGIIDQYPRPYRGTPIEIRLDKTNAFLGTDISLPTAVGYLEALGMEVLELDGNRLRVTPPSFRIDLLREVDLMEEVARLVGFENIPVTIPPIRPMDLADASEIALANRSREIMVGMGFTETISFSFMSPEAAGILGWEEGSDLRSYVELLNPLTGEQSVMRTSLVPGLLLALRTNVSRGEEDLKLFEWGRVFFSRGKDELPQERPSLAAVLTGASCGKEWYREARDADFFDIKGILEGLLRGLGLQKIRFSRGETPPYYRPEVSARAHLGGVPVGCVGQIADGVLAGFDIRVGNAFLLELDMASCREEMPENPRFEAFARFPAVIRDVSLLVKRETEAARILEIIKREGGDLVDSVHLFDCYQGERLERSEKALAFRVCYRSKEGTLDGKEINRLHEGIVEKIHQETGGRLREV